MLVPVILSGGIGSRLWPLSREQNPKQFLSLVGEDSMFCQTYHRVKSIAQASPIVVCNDDQRFRAAEQLRAMNVDGASILLEPVGRNTAPAVAAAAFVALQQHKNAQLLILPSDHVIADESAFHLAIQQGLKAADQGQLVTFGIIPASPETGFGYIQQGEALEAGFTIQQFVEKPELAVAESYLSSGDYLWNSGMFLLSAQVYLDELKKYAPLIFESVKTSVEKASKDLDFTRLEFYSFVDCPEDSIDYAVMEHTEKGVVVPLDCGWSDLGSWSTLWEVGDQNSDGNVAQGDVLFTDTQNTYVRSESRLVTTLGLNNIVVVETEDAVLVADKDKVQDVKTIVKELAAQGRSEAAHHARVFRPWGSYQSIAIADRFQVKHIIVNPGQKLSLQMHHHRAEHWVIVKGTALVTCGDSQQVLTEDQSTYIPLGTLHRLENPGVIPLELIEVQSGSYLGEDDIVRFDDDYGRSH